jgi:hypothetical protein
MLVYGDCRRVDSPRRLALALRTRSRARPTGRSAVREWATTLLIDSGELVQGLLDAQDVRAGDAGDDRSSVCRDLALGAARLFLVAERDGRGAAFDDAIDSIDRALARFAGPDLPAEVEIHVPEGYAYYAVYPALYALAAENLRVWGNQWVVFGVRSIGTSLGAVVAAVLKTDALYFVRPRGPPFRRTLPFHRELEQALSSFERQAHYAIVDEGPGLSGSSFGAVADWLQRHGVSSGRLHFLPSHAGELGPQASEPHRERWKRADRCHFAYESYFDEARLRSVVFDGAQGEISDISAGRWRAERFADSAEWPAIHAGLERRKYLLRENGSTFIAKFVGLGSYGRAQFERALLLHRHGFVPEPLAYRDGFLISAWHDTATAIQSTPEQREAWLARAAQYLTLLGSLCRVRKSNASLEELLHMASVNIGEGLGRHAAELVEARWRGCLGAIATACVPVAIDGRMHPWEWLVLRDGRLLKADALEHHADHGLVGCQDLAWDLAGLRTEHAMTACEYERMLAVLADASCYRPQPEKEAFFACCYLAYQMGYYALAADAAEGSDPADQRRALLRRDFYANQLRDLLERKI